MVMKVLEDRPDEITYGVELRGAPLRLLRDFTTHTGPPVVREYLIEGPAGTGKTRGIGHVLRALMDEFPGIRILVVRETRASLTESFCVTWEDHCVEPESPMLEGAVRANRHSYIHPNGSELVLGGLDKPGRLYSTEWDVVYCVQAEELLDSDPWFRFRRALRRFVSPLQALIADVNPDVPTHWLNLRAEDGKMVRCLTKHEDNPAYWDVPGKRWTEEGTAYLSSLDELPDGVLKDRLRWGKWVAAPGQVWPNFDRRIHLIGLPDPEVDPRTGRTSSGYELLGIRSYFATQDWGWTAPGVLQVWGVDADKRLIRVGEVYQAGKDIEWWAGVAAQVVDRFPLEAIVCDHEPKAIGVYNDMLSAKGRGRIAWHANKEKASSPSGDFAGLDLVRWGFSKDATGTPRIRFLREALLWGRDEALVAARKPWCTEQEIPAYVMLKDTNGNVLRDQTDPRCIDHGCDATRYAATWNWRHDIRPSDPAVEFAPGTYGALLGSVETLAAEHRRRMRND